MKRKTSSPTAIFNHLSSLISKRTIAYEKARITLEDYHRIDSRNHIRF
ncbi:MAG: hypothetical protein ACI9EQ_002475, partial [Bacteroidia bacterium]